MSGDLTCSPGSVEEEGSLALVAGEGGGALEFGAGLLMTPELEEQIAAHAGEQMVALESWLLGEGIDERESDGRT